MGASGHGPAARPVERRVFGYDCLRIMATMAVICLHVSSSNWSAEGIGSRSWYVFNAYEGAVRWSVPVFVMLSGALLLDRRGGGRSMGRRILRIVTAFCFWSLLYALDSAGRPPVWSDVLRRFVTGHYHMWFLFMIVGLYLMAPILRQIAASRAATEYFLLAALLFNFLLPRILGLGGLIPIPWLADALNTLRAAYEKMSLQLPVGYTGYFLLGHYLRSRRLSARARRTAYALGLAGLGLTIGLTAAIGLWTGVGTEYFYSNYEPGVLLTAAGLFVWGSYALPVRPAPWLGRLTAALSQYCFGAYLVHALVLSRLTRLAGLTTLSFEPLLSVPAITLLTFAISMAISALLNHIPLLRRYIV